jgi:hypothetical protein
VIKFTMHRKLPDLTQTDFSVSEIMKDRVYSVKIRDLEHLKERIESQFENLFSQNICDTICASVLQRCNRCNPNGGGHFEHNKFSHCTQLSVCNKEIEDKTEIFEI